MKPSFKRSALALAGLSLLTLYGCGGGSTTATAPDPVVASTTAVPVTVIDDAIGNAMVCLDKNSNGACDANEPFGKTDAAGKVTLQVASADVGKFPILALIGVDAVDAKYGPVTKAYTMTAPADQSAVVSPLTTLVQSMVANAGITSSEAAASVQSQTGISVSLFQDFTKSSTPESSTAGEIARMVVLISQQQAAVLKDAVGSTAIDGTVIKSADLDKIIRNKLLEILPDLMTSLADPVVQAALKAATTPAQATAALLIPANALIADAATGLSATSVATLAAINNQNQTPVAVAEPAAPVATATLRTLTFTTAGNWFVRAFTSSAAQNTPDAANTIRYVARNSSSSNVGGTAVANWNQGSSASRQSDLHFSGTAWVNCAVNGENVSSVRDAAGNSTYNHCNQLETGKSNRATFDVAGKPMASVITSVRAAGYTNLSIGDNSPAALTSALGSTAFPAGASVIYQATTALAYAPAYYPGLGNYVTQSAANVAAGRTDPNVAAACSAAVIPTPPDATSLEALATANAGTPCINNAGTATVTTPALTTAVVSSGSRNENWGSTSLSIGVIGTALTGGIQTSYYTTNTPIRVTFGAGNSTRYFACQQRSTDGSTRNCNQIGAGSYAITTLGDARVMTFTGLPGNAAPLTYERVFVERGGKVYFGYQNKPGVFSTARLNLAGSNALLTQLGMGLITPETPMALTRESYAGTWDLSNPASPTNVTRISILANGGSACVNLMNGAGTSFTCNVSVSNADKGVFNYSDSAGSGSGTLNFLSGAAAGAYTNSATALTTSFTGARR